MCIFLGYPTSTKGYKCGVLKLTSLQLVEMLHLINLQCFTRERSCLCMLMQESNVLVDARKQGALEKV